VLEAESVQVLGTLCSVQGKKTFAVQKPWETEFVCNEKMEKCVEDYVVRVTSVGTQRVQVTETVMIQQPEHMGNVETG